MLGFLDFSVIRCPFPELKNGRQVTGFRKKYYYQATIMFDCNVGYHLQGSETVVCNSNNTWEPPIPTCVKGTKLWGAVFIFVFEFMDLALNRTFYRTIGKKSYSSYL